MCTFLSKINVKISNFSDFRNRAYCKICTFFCNLKMYTLILQSKSGVIYTYFQKSQKSAYADRMHDF